MNYVLSQTAAYSIALTLITAGSLETQPQTREVRRMAPDPAPKKLVLPRDSIEVPMHRVHKIPAVEVMINGKGPYRLLVDTGAPGLVLDQRVADELSLPGPADMAGDSAVEIRVSSGRGGGIPAKIGWVDSLHVGELEMRGLTAISLELPFKRDHDGVLGMGAFRDCLLTFDYLAGKMRFSKGALPEPDGRDVVSYTTPRQAHSHPVISVETCGESVDFTIDTGSSGWFRATEAIAKQCGFESGPVDGPPGRSVDTVIDTKFGRLKGEFKIGRHSVLRPIVMLDQMEMPPLVGSRFLEKFAVTFDSTNSRVRFARESSEAITPPPMRHAGFGLIRGENGLEVWNVLPGSPAEKTGLKVGDIVTHIDGLPAAEVYENERWDELVERASLAVEYKPSDGGGIRTIDVKIIELVR